MSFLQAVSEAGATLTWETAADWDGAASESGVAHESVANTDHNDATIIKQGYSVESPLRSVDLVGYWPLHEDSGSTANDFSGNNNDGTINGPAVGVTGPLGTTGYSYDGVDDIVSVPGLFNDGESFSIAAVVKRTDSSVHPVLWHAQDPWCFSFRIHSDDTLRLAMPGTTNFTSSLTVPADDFTFVGVTMDASTTTANFYLDSSTESSGGSLPSSSNNNVSSIGNRAEGNRVLTGTISTVYAWNAILSASEMQTLADVLNTSGSMITAAKVS